jgi:hypothetical protein
MANLKNICAFWQVKIFVSNLFNKSVSKGFQAFFNVVTGNSESFLSKQHIFKSEHVENFSLYKHTYGRFLNNLTKTPTS